MIMTLKTLAIKSWFKTLKKQKHHFLAPCARVQYSNSPLYRLFGMRLREAAAAS